VCPVYCPGRWRCQRRCRLPTAPRAGKSSATWRGSRHRHRPCTCTTCRWQPMPMSRPCKPPHRCLFRPPPAFSSACHVQSWPHPLELVLSQVACPCSILVRAGGHRRGRHVGSRAGPLRDFSRHARCQGHGGAHARGRNCQVAHRLGAGSPRARRLRMMLRATMWRAMDVLPGAGAQDKRPRPSIN
jgi:hypothetical protein